METQSETQRKKSVRYREIERQRKNKKQRERERYRKKRRDTRKDAQKEKVRNTKTVTQTKGRKRHGEIYKMRARQMQKESERYIKIHMRETRICVLYPVTSHSRCIHGFQYWLHLSTMYLYLIVKFQRIKRSLAVRLFMLRCR